MRTETNSSALARTAFWATSRPRLASKVTPSPHPGQGAYTGALWDPLAKIAPGQVAGNSNLKLGDRALADAASCISPKRLSRRFLQVYCVLYSSSTLDNIHIWYE